MGRSPVAGIVNKNGEPGRTPKIFAPLMRGVTGTGGVRISGVLSLFVGGAPAGCAREVSAAKITAPRIMLTASRWVVFALTVGPDDAGFSSRRAFKNFNTLPAAGQSLQLQPVECLRPVGIDGVGNDEMAVAIKLIGRHPRPLR